MGNEKMRFYLPLKQHASWVNSHIFNSSVN